MELESNLTRVINTLRIFCGGAVLGIATLVLIGWEIRQPLWLTWIPNAKPMVPVTAWCLWMGAIVLLSANQAKSVRFFQWLFPLLSFFILIVSVANLFQPTWFQTEAADWIPPGKASPLTGIALLAASLGLLVHHFGKKPKKMAHLLTSLLGLLSMGIGLLKTAEHIFLLQTGYSPSINALTHLSFPTSVSLIFLSFGILFMDEKMPLPKTLFQPTMRHSFIRIYLAVSLILVTVGAFFAFQSAHRTLIHTLPQEMTSTLGGLLLGNLLYYLFLGVTAGTFFVVLIGLYLSRRFQKSFEKMRNLMHHMESGLLGEGSDVVDKNEWLELKEIQISMIQTGKNLIDARYKLQKKLEEIEKKDLELRDSQKIALSLLEDADESNQKLEEAKKTLRQLNLSLESKVEARARELKSVQEKLFRSEKLAALGQMASAVAHEIRNPLSALMNAAYFLKMCEAEIPNEEVKKHLMLINKQVGLIDQIIYNLLDFAKVKEPEKQPTDFSKLIRETIEKFPPPSGIQLSVETPKEKIPPIAADPVQIGQIFGNLVTNAYQAMPKGGTLKISMERQNGEIYVNFEDSGVGISPENMEKIFQPFFSTKPKGTGLGLAICRQLVEKHGGSLGVKSTHGQGAKFILKLLV